MKQSKNTFEPIKLVGIRVRTSNALEHSPATAYIGKTLNKYFGNKRNKKFYS